MPSQAAAEAVAAAANMAKLKERSLEARVVRKAELYSAISRPLQICEQRRTGDGVPLGQTPLPPPPWQTAGRSSPTGTRARASSSRGASARA